MPTIKLDLNELERELGSEAADFMLELSNELVNQFKQNVNTGATGDLQRSFQIFRRNPTTVVLGSRLDYAAAVNYGRGPHEPDFEAIQTWARRKLGDESAAGAVYNKIRAEGTKPNPYIDRAIDETLDGYR